MKVTNISPIGDLVVPALGLEVAAGASVEVSEEAGAALLEQSDVWALADRKPGKAAAVADPAPVVTADPA